MSEDKKRILVVEDNRIAALMVKACLEELGCQVDMAKNGKEAVTMATQNHYDAISMDIGLPLLSGIEACKAIRKHEMEHHLPAVPIIAVTANNNTEETAEYLAAGMQEVIGKPLTKESAIHFLSFCK